MVCAHMQPGSVPAWQPDGEECAQEHCPCLCAYSSTQHLAPGPCVADVHVMRCCACCAYQAEGVCMRSWWEPDGSHAPSAGLLTFSRAVKTPNPLQVCLSVWAV